MRRKREPGEPLTEHQEDFVAGRCEFQKQRALEAKKVRSYLAQNPGASVPEIRKGSGVENVNAALSWLEKRKLIGYGLTGYYVIPL